MKPLTCVETLVRGRPWLARAMLVVCSLSLLATSPEHEPGADSARLHQRSDAPSCTLTADAPACEFRVTLTHDAADFVATERASASVSGIISATGVSGDQPFVAVRVTTADPAEPSDLSALTQFSIARSLTFTGECGTPAGGGDCVSELGVSFRRADLGERGGTLQVRWELDLEASPPYGVDAGTTELPWTVEYTEP